MVSPQNPLKRPPEAGPEMDRFEMAEIACAASKYPDNIKPSVVEFMLDKPSYTIHTLRHLTENYGTQMRFSILMGDDLVPQLPEWKQYREILEYPILRLSPRAAGPTGFGGRITVLEDAPLYQDFASTDVRDRIGRGEDVGNMLPKGVAGLHPPKKDLWSPASYIASLTTDAGDPRRRRLYVDARQTPLPVSTNGAQPSTTSTGRCKSIRQPRRSPRQYARMVQEILEFRYKDIYNP